MMKLNLPYSSQRLPVFARNIVATSQPLATSSGLRILQKGGNAVDAAIAMAIVLTVVEPTGNGIGSDAFVIVWDCEKLHGLNASGRSPENLKCSKFEGMAKMPNHGWDSITVPGAVSAWVELSSKFGKLPFDELFRGAIDYARNGFPVSQIISNQWGVASRKQAYLQNPEFVKTFLPNRRSPKAGEIFKSEYIANTLEEIAATRGESFYKGSLAQKMINDAQTNGVNFTISDFEKHQIDWVGTISKQRDENELHEIPPNGQGIAALIALAILERFEMEKYPVDSAQSLHLQIEAMKSAFVETYKYVADPDCMQVQPKDLLKEQRIEALAETINLKHASMPGPTPTIDGGTVYLTAADQSGMMVSFIQSNFQGFGSGVVIPGTGISLQNRGAGFSLEKNHPNQIAGGKRPFHTIIPGFVMHNNQPLMSFGIMGGDMQPQAHLQFFLRTFLYKQNPQAALDAPRWKWVNGLQVGLEPGFPENVYSELQKMGHQILDHQKVYFGGGQAIYKMQDCYFGASDKRKDGGVQGY